MLLLATEMNTNENYLRSIEKAKALKLHAKRLGFGKYEVTGESGARYTVSYLIENGKHYAKCTCDAHVKRNLACKHIFTPLGHYKIELVEYLKRKKAEREARALITPPPVPSAPVPAPEPVVEAPKLCKCGGEATTPEGLCSECQIKKDKADLFG